ncbi:hypothetical protein FE257_000690 [Aspergillus nanangensis]|uniref:CBM6 domain-containing protein n=1 Tax=Aspergillus nanangensis TaxID=2582783 RepID=A0AAD4GPE8_ASPNN|nr:hypothetical protein FE257_000690 [Aspergillus nanangensis]
MRNWTAWSLLLSFGMLLRYATLSRADNPIVQTIYTADPAPLVHDDRLYIFTGHDEDGWTTYNMLDWRVFSTTDMQNWQHYPVPMSLDTFGWANAQAWAGQVVARNGQFYFYVPVRNAATNGMAIGVGVSDNVTGPYQDAIGGPLLENNEIDPTVFVNDDGQAYMYWGNPNLWYVTLNSDMVSYTGEINQVELTVEGFGERLDNPERPTTFEEGPWLEKRDELYYLIYAANCCSEDIQYSIGPTATGPWTYRGVIMPAEGASFTNHPGVVQYRNASYFTYHNGALPGGSGYTRPVAVERFDYNPDGTIPELQMTTEGPARISGLDPYVRQEAETIAWGDGVETEDCSEGTLNIRAVSNGAYIKVGGVTFNDGAAGFIARVASVHDGCTIELHLDSPTGPLVGTCSVPVTGDRQSWETQDHGILRGVIREGGSGLCSCQPTSPNKTRPTKTSRISNHRFQIALNSFIITIPVCTLTAVLLGLVFRNQVGHGDTPFEHLRGNLTQGESDVYYINMNSSVILFVASWASSLAPMLLGFILALASFPIARQLFEDARGGRIDRLLTPYQLALILKFLDGSAISGIWN